MSAPELPGRLRAIEPDRYLSLLYAPEAVREDIAALYVFDAEVASIRERVHEALPGEIRIQWWRDTLAAGEPTGSPVADALIAAIGRHGLPLAGFAQYLDARIADLYDDPMPDIETLEAYCGATSSTLMQMAAMALDPAAAPRAAEAAGHGGCAEAITRLVWSLPKHRARGQCHIPAEMLAAAGTSVEEFLSDRPGEGGLRAARMMIALAREHFGKFSASAASLSAALRPAFLPVAVTPLRLNAAERAGASLLTQPPRILPLRRQWRIWRAAVQGWAG